MKIMLLVLIITFCDMQVEAQTPKQNDYFTCTNAFTPNGDSINDKWKFDWQLKVDSFSLKVFNRWGEEIYVTSDKNFEWDGTNKKGKAVDEGMYVWLVDIKSFGVKETIKGMVTVLK